MSFHSFAANCIFTQGLANNGIRTTGTAVTSALADMSKAEYAAIVLSIGTATAGSVTYVEAIAGTSATDTTGGTVSLGTLALTSGTIGQYIIEVKADQLPGSGTVFLGARAFIPSGGSVGYGISVIQHRVRNLPPTNGLAGSAFIVT